MNNLPAQPQKTSGPLTGGTICLILGLAVMFWSLWYFVVYGPLILVAVILAVVAMAKGRVAGGLILLLATLIIPVSLWVMLSLSRTETTLRETSQKLDEITPFGLVLHPPSSPAPPPEGLAAIPTSEQKASLNTQTPTAVPANSKIENNDQKRVMALRANDLSRTSAQEISVALTITLATDADYVPKPTFSADSRFVSFVTIDKDAVVRTIQIWDLQTLTKLSSHIAPKSDNGTFPVDCMTFSPDNSKLLLNCNYYSWWLLSPKDGQLQKLPIEDRINTREIWWKTVGNVIIHADEGWGALNTETLRIHNAFGDEEQRLQRAVKTADRWIIEHDNRAKAFVIRDRNGMGQHRLTQPSDDEPSKYAVSPNQRYLVSITNGRLQVFYLGSQRMPSQFYTVELDTQAQFSQSNKSSFDDAMRRHVLIDATVYPPRINPLTGKVVGAQEEKEKEKGTVRFVGAVGINRFRVQMESGDNEFAIGDVISDIGWHFEPGHNGSSAHSWGTIVSIDSDAPQSNSKESMSKLLIGKWRSERHSTEYFPDGTFTYDGNDKSRGQWRLVGSQLTQGKMELAITLLNETDLQYKDVSDGLGYEWHRAK